MPTTVTGKISNLDTTGNSNSFVRFWLRGLRGNEPRITGVGSIAPQTAGSSFYVDIPADANGNVSGTIYSTRDSSGTGNGEIEVAGSYTAVYYGMVIYSGSIPGPEVPVHAKNGATLDITSVTPVSRQPIVTAPTGDTTYLRLDAGNISSAANAFLWSTPIKFKTQNNIRFADQFASISAAITDLGGNGGVVFIPAGTYLDNIVITSNNVTLQGAGIGVTIIKPSNTALPVLTIDGTGAGISAIDGVQVCDLSIYPVTATSCDAGIQIKGKTASNQPNDHHRFMRLEVGGGPFTPVNSTGTNNFRMGIEIIGRTIWTSMDRVFVRGTRGDGLKASLTVGTEGPLNAFYVTNSEFNYNFGYGINLSISGASTPGAANHFLNCDTESNCNNTALSPAAGFLINGVWNCSITNHYFENNCPSSADANSAQLRITGSLLSPQSVTVNGLVAVMTAGGANYCIYDDAARQQGSFNDIRLVGTAATAAIHSAATSTDSHVIVSNGTNLKKIDTVVDAGGNSHISAPAMNLFARKVINTAFYPFSSNSFDLVTSGGGIDYPNTNLGITGGPVTLNTITSGAFGQYLWLDSVSGAITLTQNSGGAGSFKFNDSTTRVLQTGDAVLMRHDGTNWQEVALGTALLGKANTWLQNQSFNGAFSKYNGLSTVRGGVPSDVAFVDLTGQTAAVATATLLAAPVAGQYRLNWNAKVTTAAATSSTLGALTIVYTDPDGVAQTITAPASIAGGTIATSASTNTTATVLLGLPLILNVKSGTNVTYAFAYASNAANTMQYNLHITLELQ